MAVNSLTFSVLATAFDSRYPAVRLEDRRAVDAELLARPRLLVMDEATNALDSTSALQVIETVNRLRKDICVIVVAHRLSAVRGADLVAAQHMDLGS